MPRDRGDKYQPIGEARSWAVGEAKTLRFQVFGTITDLVDWEATFRLATEEGGVALIEITATVAEPTEPEEAAQIAAVVEVEVAEDDYATLTGDTYWYEVFRSDTGNNGLLAFGPAVLGQRLQEAAP